MIQLGVMAELLSQSTAVISRIRREFLQRKRTNLQSSSSSSDASLVMGTPITGRYFPAAFIVYL